jgi:uncharacterized protein involved in exopolysaccharide biosynthesis
MDLKQARIVIRRWAAIVVLAALVVTIVAGWRILASDAQYEATVKLQLTAPQAEDISIFDRNVRATNIRDDMTVARNNFTEILQSREVSDRTTRQLSLSGEDANYKIDVRPLRDSDYFVVAVQSRKPGLVGQIVNVHVSMAIAYYGEVRAKPILVVKSFIAGQVAQADQRVRTAEAAIVDFQMQNKVTNVTNDIASTQKIIDDLLLERNHRVLLGASSRLTDTSREDPATSTAPVDTLITQHRNGMLRLMALQPRYNTLQNILDQARNDYQSVTAKYNQAVQLEQSVQEASFIQVIEPGATPAAPMAGRPLVVIALALIAGLVVGITLAFVLDRLFPLGIRMPRPTLQRPSVDITQPRGKTARR